MWKSFSPLSRHVRRAVAPARIARRALGGVLHSAIARLTRRVVIPQRRQAGKPPRVVTMLVADDRIDRRVLLQARSLARVGMRVTVIASPYPAEEGQDLDALAWPEIEIVRIQPETQTRNLFDATVTRLGALGALADALFIHHTHFLEAAMTRPADLVVAHDLPVLATALTAADLMGARLHFDAHEIFAEQYRLPGWRRVIYRAVERRLAPLADIVTTVNQSIADEMTRRDRIAPPNIILNVPDVVAGGIERRGWDLRQKLGIREQCQLILFHGAFFGNRNLETLIEAMSYVSDPTCTLVLMGPNGEAKQALEGLAESRNLIGGRVRFLPPVPQNELIATVASADFGVIPYPGVDMNTIYCSPNKLFDFIVAGVPILANDLPELRRFVVESGVGLVHAMTDARAIAAGIDRMATNDKVAMREAARRLAPTMCWSHEEQAFLSLYGISSARAAQ
jgi:glycosyltransferase involved in cell wall biosynthesis